MRLLAFSRYTNWQKSLLPSWASGRGRGGHNRGVMSSNKPTSKKVGPRKRGTGVSPATVVAEKAGSAVPAGSLLKLPAKKRTSRKWVEPPAVIEDRIKRFAQEYIVDFNQTAAYIRTGFKASGASAASAASVYMTRPDVQAAIAEAKAERAARMEAKGGLTQDLVLKVLQQMLTHDPRRMYNPDGSLKNPKDMDDDTAMALVGVEVSEIKTPAGKVLGHTKKAKVSDRASAITLAMRHLGMLNDKLQLNHSGQVQVIDMARLSVLTDTELQQLDVILDKLHGAGL